MVLLDVPHRKQINATSCGAAALEMVYKFYRPSKLSVFDQAKVYRKAAHLEPHGSGNYQMSSAAIVSAAQGRGLKAGLARFPNDKTAMLKEFRGQLEAGSPVIVCQQFSKEQPLLGHFRVVVGLDGETLKVHDPHLDHGPVDWSADDFLAAWQATSLNVTGLVAILIERPAR
jgi:ABC-type bacteriocin/lantibiotic exporter with double-glycine peptidase domain